MNIPYTPRMRSVADGLRRETRRELAAMTPAERVGVALELGERDLRAYADHHGLTRKEALELFQRQRTRGRRHSRCATRLLE